MYSLSTLARACVASEFTMFATKKSSAAIDWLRALAKLAHEERGGPGVGAIGMCFTGGFALAMMVDDRMLAPVLSQPSLPVPLTAAQKRDVGLDDATLARVKERAAHGACVMGLRFPTSASRGCAKSSATLSSPSRSTRAPEIPTDSAPLPTRSSRRTTTTRRGTRRAPRSSA
jgi:hypothetical protein